jgi:hypothetical protein
LVTRDVQSEFFSRLARQTYGSLVFGVVIGNGVGE